MRLFLLLLFIGTQTIAQESSLLWQITKPGIKDTSYLYGTIHLPLKELFHVNDSLSSVLDKVDAGYFEIIFSTEGAKELAPLMMVNSKESLDKILSEEDFKVVKKYLRKHHTLESMLIKKVKPMVLTSVVVEGLIEKDTSNAMDFLFQNYLTEKDKKVVGLETMREQAELLFNSPIDLQAQELLDCIANVDSVKGVLELMLTYYKNQDLKKLDSLVNIEGSVSSIDLKDLNEKRNIKMIPKLDDAMQKESILIAVGAAHLSGEKGIIALLEEKGYQLKPIK